MGKFEINVRESTAELEKAIKMNAENPVTEIEKKLWKDFINNPERMEKTVKNMEVYNIKRKNQNCSTLVAFTASNHFWSEFIFDCLYIYFVP